MPSPPPSLTRLRRRALALLITAGLVNYLDRAALSIATPHIQAELHLDYTQMGLLLSAFAWAYGLAQLPAGALVDRAGPGRVLGASLSLWSTAQAAAGLATTLPQLFVARLALGFCESPLYLGGTRVCAEWYPRAQRALPIALFNASSALAPALAPPLLTWLMLAYGWRAMFLLAGLAGFALALLWAALYRAPAASGLPADMLANLPPPPATNRPALAQTLHLLRQPAAWGMALGFFGMVYVSWLYGTWLPAYLETARNLSIARAGSLAALPLACGFAGAVSAGFIANRLSLLGMDAATACRLPTLAGLIISALCTIAAPLAPSTPACLALMAAGLFAINLASSCGWALAALIAPLESIATLEAIQNLGGSAGGVLAPLLTGALKNATGSFTPGFVLAGAVALLAACSYGYLAARPMPRAS